MGGPYRERAVFGERSTDPPNARLAVKSLITFDREAFGPVVDIEDNEVKRILRSQPDHLGHITFKDRDSRVICGGAGELCQVGSIPLDDCGKHFRDDNLGARGQSVECGPQGEAHSETPDEDSRAFRAANLRASEAGDRFFG